MQKIGFESYGKKTGLRSAVYVLEKGLSPDIYYSGDGAGWLVQWDLGARDEGTLVAKVPANIFALRLIPSLHIMAIGTLQGEVYLVDLKQGKLLDRSFAFGSAVFDMVLDGLVLYVATGSGILYSIDLQDLHLSRAYALSDQSLRAVICSKFGTLYVAGSSGVIYQFTPEKPGREDERLLGVKKLLGHENSVFALAETEKGDLYSGSRDAHLHLWRVGELELRIPAHLLTINSLAVIPSLGLLASGSRDRTIKLWSTRSMKLLKVIEKSKLETHTYSINSLLWIPERSILISGGDDKQLFLWRIYPD